MRVYLDTCCLNRPFDDLLQPRVRVEAAAVGRILRGIQARQLEWLTSDVLFRELVRRPVGVASEIIAGWLAMATHHIENTPALSWRAESLRGSGMHLFDALHIASAESGGADALLTTDDRLIRAARRGGAVRLPVVNPVEWYGGWNNEIDR